MGNSGLMGMLVNAAMPTVEKIVGSGRIDEILRELKNDYRRRTELPEGYCVEIMVTTEDDGCEYLSVVTLSPDKRIDKVLYQSKLSEVIVAILKESKKCQ